jgi:CBS domain-containing protein
MSSWEGKKLEVVMLVSEVMHKGVSSVQIHDSIKKVASLMKREDIGAVPVYKNERPVGFVTDRDIVVSCLAEGASTDHPVSQAMTRDIITVREKDDLTLASKLMRENQISRLLVIDEGNRPVGMITLHDIIINTQDDNLKISVINEIKR